MGTNINTVKGKGLLYVFLLKPKDFINSSERNFKVFSSFKFLKSQNQNQF